MIIKIFVLCSLFLAFASTLNAENNSTEPLMCAGSFEHPWYCNIPFDNYNPVCQYPYRLKWTYDIQSNYLVIDVFTKYEANHTQNSTAKKLLKRVGGLVQINLDNKWFLSPSNVSIIDDSFNWYIAQDSRIAQISDGHYQVRQKVDQDEVKCARLGLLTFEIDSETNSSKLMHRVSSSQEICSGLCEKYDADLLKKVGLYFEKTLFSEYLNTEQAKRKRSIIIEIPTFSEMKQFLNTKVKTLRNKTLHGIDWLREKILSLDNFEEELETKLSQIKKQNEAKLFDLIEQDPKLKNVLFNYMEKKEKGAEKMNENQQENNDIVVYFADKNPSKTYTQNENSDIDLANKRNFLERKKRGSAGVLNYLMIKKPQRKNFIFTEKLSTTTEASSANTLPATTSISLWEASANNEQNVTENTAQINVTLTTTTTTTISKEPSTTTETIQKVEQTSTSTLASSPTASYNISGRLFAMIVEHNNQSIESSTVSSATETKNDDDAGHQSAKVDGVETTKFLLEATDSDSSTTEQAGKASELEFEELTTIGELSLDFLNPRFQHYNYRTTNNMLITITTKPTTISEQEFIIETNPAITATTPTSTTTSTTTTTTTTIEEDDEIDDNRTDESAVQSSSTSTTTTPFASTFTTTYKETSSPNQNESNEENHNENVASADNEPSAAQNEEETTIATVKYETSTSTETTTVSQQSETFIHSDNQEPILSDKSNATNATNQDANVQITTTEPIGTTATISIQDASTTSQHEIVTEQEETTSTTSIWTNENVAEQNEESQDQTSAQTVASEATQTTLTTTENYDKEEETSVSTTTSSSSQTYTRLPLTTVTTTIDNNAKLEVMNYSIVQNYSSSHTNSPSPISNNNATSGKNESRTYSLRLHLKGFKWNEKYNDPNSAEAQQFLKSRILPLLLKNLNLKQDDLNDIKLIKLFKALNNSKSNSSTNNQSSSQNNDYSKYYSNYYNDSYQAKTQN